MRPRLPTFVFRLLGLLCLQKQSFCTNPSLFSFLVFLFLPHSVFFPHQVEFHRRISLFSLFININILWLFSYIVFTRLALLFRSSLLEIYLASPYENRGLSNLPDYFTKSKSYFSGAMITGKVLLILTNLRMFENFFANSISILNPTSAAEHEISWDNTTGAHLSWSWKKMPFSSSSSKMLSIY